MGTNIKTTSETTRKDVADVVIAAGKRLGEALRSIEEFLKTACPADAAKIESIRYRFYEIERQLAATLRPADRFAAVKLYVLISESACKIEWLVAAEAAIDGGADCLQLREKTLADGQLLAKARKLTQLCHRRGVLCIINDRPDIAVLAGTDGVHLGQDDLAVDQARKIIGGRGIIGVSTHNIDQARGDPGWGGLHRRRPDFQKPDQTEGFRGRLGVCCCRRRPADTEGGDCGNQPGKRR